MDRVGVEQFRANMCGFETVWDDAARRDSMDCIVSLRVLSCLTFESSNAKQDDERSFVVYPMSVAQERKTQIVIQADHVEQSLRRVPPLEEIDRRSGHQVRSASDRVGWTRYPTQKDKTRCQ